ncbi:carbohydrate ABC transporter permease [Paenibacillus sp. KQZ6P-2]|uniref:Carbohydrate ABC transporter permease n=1 Tax=Paenibacillus mangrovi TaxID=2931978 RepID=A0A9X1WTE0_9BACL|nr:carbohydrate ABC transporter permease [Paenibacillus mangrovi]MCJ8014739.1 carbohydrate ABC transporter permease [Paenibacillus mangrovi]
MSKLIKPTVGDRIFDVIIHLVLCVGFIVVAYPLLYVVSASFSNPQAVVSGKVWLFPVNPTLQGYAAVFKNPQIVTGFMNSLFYMIVGTLLNIVMTVIAAYPLSRKELQGRNVVTLFFVITMFFSGGLIPSYLLVKNLGLLDTRWALIIPAAMSVWNVIITRTFFQVTIPQELYEAAQIDGAGDFRFLVSIAIKLSAPIIAVMALYYGVGHWNTYFSALIYLKSPELFPLQIILRSILVINNIDPTMVVDFEVLQRKQGLTDVLKYSVIVVASVPVLLIYPFVQKYFVKGVMIGSIKG